MRASPAERLAVLRDRLPVDPEPVSGIRDGDSVIGEAVLPELGLLSFEATDIRSERTGVHARLAVETPSGVKAYDVCNIDRDKSRYDLAKALSSKLGEVRAGPKHAAVKLCLDEFCSNLWRWWKQGGGIEDVDVDAFLGESDPEPDWVIPGLLERGERMILIADEGAGKSTLLRQIAVQAAAGIHPFSETRGPGRRVMLVDAENSRAHVRRKLRGLTLSARPHLDGSLLRIASGFEPIDLLSRDDAQRLEDRCVAHRAELLVIGPNYKLASGDPLSEESARVVTGVIDRIRHKTGCAVLMESHMPHAHNGSRRPTRPYGASLWLRWPEYGLYLGPDFRIKHWRGPREERSWPHQLKMGGAWPWTVAEGFEGVVSDAEIRTVFQAMTEDPGARESYKCVAAAGLRVRKERVDRIRKEVFPP